MSKIEPISCPHCDSWMTEWSDETRSFKCWNCNKEIRLQDSLNSNCHDSLMVGKEDIMPGDRVLAYDHLKKKDRCATVVKRYGIVAHREGSYLVWPYQDLCDVDFDGGFISKEDGLSKGHFTYGLKKAA
jgi:hypothetical protein